MRDVVYDVRKHLNGRIDGLLEVLDIGLQSPLQDHWLGDPAMEGLCWLCNYERGDTPIGLCERCRAWCRFESDEEPVVYAHTAGGRYPLQRFPAPTELRVLEGDL